MDDGDESPNVRASSYLLARSTRHCGHCGRQTHVFAIILPAGHETLGVEDDPCADEWEVSPAPTLLSHVSSLSAPDPECLRALAPGYRLDHGRTAEGPYWMNHCEHCEAPLADVDTVEEYDSAFNPARPEGAAAIVLRELSGPFAARCGANTEDLPSFEAMRRA